MRQSETELYIVTYSLTDKKELELRARDLPEGQLADMLMASAYFPAFRSEKLGGKRYTDGGVTGAELDVFETKTDYDTSGKEFGAVFHTVHVDAYEEAHRWENQGSFYADDPYNEFNTYGVEWNEEGYVFYINGVETARTDFGGVCKVPLYLIISIGVDENVTKNEFLPASMLVDYVRCYQYKK